MYLVLCTTKLYVFCGESNGGDAPRSKQRGIRFKINAYLGSCRKIDAKVAKQKALKEALSFSPKGDVYKIGQLPRQDGKAQRVFHKKIEAGK